MIYLFLLFKQENNVKPIRDWPQTNSKPREVKNQNLNGDVEKKLSSGNEDVELDVWIVGEKINQERSCLK